MKGERWYVGTESETGSGQPILLGWNLPHEPSPDNECGYRVIGGPYRTKEEALEEYPNAR